MLQFTVQLSRKPETRFPVSNDRSSITSNLQFKNTKSVCVYSLVSYKIFPYILLRNFHHVVIAGAETVIFPSLDKCNTNIKLKLRVCLKMCSDAVTCQPSCFHTIHRFKLYFFVLGIKCQFFGFQNIFAEFLIFDFIKSIKLTDMILLLCSSRSMKDLMFKLIAI